jgi:GNAT superfamily N-acetyltransferase
VIISPGLLTAAHELSDFSCGHASLDDWLRRRALANQDTGASRTYVLAEGERVIGYYALAAGSVALLETPGRMRRNMPNPIPVMVLGRFALDLRWQGRGLGADMLRDAVLRTQQAANIGGMRALLVHAIDDRAAGFYLRWGFQPSPMTKLTLFLPLHDAA